MERSEKRANTKGVEVVETDLVRRLAQFEPQPLLHLCRWGQEGARPRRAKGW